MPQAEKIMLQIQFRPNTNIFLHEEENMESIDHPELELQKRQHPIFCEKIDEADMRGLRHRNGHMMRS